jgi:16S rRNA C967 or C1407 C5-methylase (RsmB/RsmF family)
MKQKDRRSGAEQFEDYYSQLFGARWAALKKALLEEAVYVSYDAGGEERYFLDPASVLAAKSLPLAGAKNILDMCAAPGGKTLVIASTMDLNSRLDSNERSPDRKQRLDRVVHDSLPAERAALVRTSCSDGATWCTRQSECYDRILLDAPCSSERHVLCDPKYLSQWSPNRIKSLAMEQWALLSSAWRLLSPDGCLLYATCALSPKENDEVVARLFTKFDGVESVWKDSSIEEIGFNTEFVVNRQPHEAAAHEVAAHEVAAHEAAAHLTLRPEKTTFGCHVLPDTSNGAGPLYFSLLHKANLA